MTTIILSNGGGAPDCIAVCESAFPQSWLSSELQSVTDTFGMNWVSLPSACGGCATMRSGSVEGVPSFHFLLPLFAFHGTLWRDIRAWAVLELVSQPRQFHPLPWQVRVPFPCVSSTRVLVLLAKPLDSTGRRENK